MEEIASARKPYLILLVLLAIIGVVFRFVGLENYPPGVFLDEQGAMVNALCMLRNHTSLYGKPWPIVFQALGGYYDSIFIYSELALVKMFGVSIATFRILPAVFLISACFGTAALAWTFFGLEAAFLALVVALFCPWSFHAGRLVWGSGVFNGFLTWALFFLWRTKTCELGGKRPYFWAILAGVFFAATMSLYRPANAVVLLLIVLMFAFRPQSLAVRFRYLFTALVTLIICGIPNLIFLMGSGWARVDSLSILGKEHMAKLGGSYLLALKEILENYRLFFSWDFLFVSGDAIYRHTPARGALGWPEACGFFCLALVLLHEMFPWKKQKFVQRREFAFLIFCLAGVIIGIFPAAQSWDSNPHALRANASWPFFVLIATLGLSKLFRSVAIGPMVTSLLFLVYIPVFLAFYFFTFPALGASWFNGEMVAAAKFAQATGDWSQFAVAVKDYGRDGPSVFPMMYKGLDCNGGLEFVQSLKQFGPPTPMPTGSVKPAPRFLGGSSNWPWPSQ